MIIIFALLRDWTYVYLLFFATNTATRDGTKTTSTFTQYIISCTSKYAYVSSSRYVQMINAVIIV